jgi:hypothetical protein
MTILWIFLILMTMAFILVYPVVVLTHQFRHEFPKFPTFNRNSDQQEESMPNSNQVKNESMLSAELSSMDE